MLSQLRTTLLFTAMAFAATAFAQVEKPNVPPPILEPLPEIKAPNVPNSGVQDEFEPAVTIRQKGKDTIEEYRRGGKVYMMKVIPGNGLPPYYLIDREGSGKFSPVDGQGNTLSGPQWLIFEF